MFKDKLQYILLWALCLGFIMPYLPSFLPATATLIGNFYIHDIIAVLCAAIVLCIFIFCSSNVTIKLNSLHLILSLFILFLIVQSFFIKTYTNYSFLAIASLVLALSLSILVNNIGITRSQIYYAIATTILLNCYWQIIACCLQLSLVTLNIPLHLYDYQLSTATPAIYNILIGSVPRISGTIYQPNLFANVLMCGIISLIYLLSLHKSNIRRWILLCLNIPLFSIVIALSFSRMMIVYTIFIFIYGIFLHVKKHIFYARACFLLTLCLSIALFNVEHISRIALSNTTSTQFYNKSLQNSNMSNRVANTLDSVTGIIKHQESKILSSDSERLMLWNAGLSIFEQHPLFGVGWGHFAQQLFILAKDKHRKITLPEFGLPFNTHNIFIELLATTGMIGFMIIVALLLYILVQVLKLPIQQQFLPFCFMMINLLHSQVEFPLFYVSYLFGFTILVSSADDSILTTIKSSLLKIVFFIIASITIWQSIVGMQNFLLLSQFSSPIALNNQNLIKSIYYKYKISVNPLWEYYSDADFAQKLMITQNIPHLHDDKLLHAIYKAIEQISAFSPYPQYLLKMALIDQLLGHSRDAKDIIAMVVAVYPNFRYEISTSLINSCADNHRLCDILLNDVKDEMYAQRHYQ